MLLSVLLHPHNMQMPYLCLQRAEEKSHCNKNPSSLPPTPTGRTNGDSKISLILYKFEFSGDFCPSGEAGFWERCRTREADGEDGLDQEVMLRASPTPKATGKGKCEVLMWHQQRKNVDKGHQKRQEAERRLIFKNKM